jgi:hypothetical protein
LPALPVFIDANALVPISITDLLLRVADKGLIEPFWCQQVLDEACRWAKALRPDVPPARIEARFAAMREAFPEAMTDTAGIDPEQYPSKDLDDRLIIGAAHRSPANLIVTRNLADFPPSTLGPLGMRAQTADRLLLGLADSDPGGVADVLREMRADMTRPALTAAEMFANLAAAARERFPA